MGSAHRARYVGCAAVVERKVLGRHRTCTENIYGAGWIWQYLQPNQT